MLFSFLFTRAFITDFIQIISISDGNAAWSISIGLEKDLSSAGFGLRTARYALVIENFVVTYVGVSIFIYSSYTYSL